MENHGTQFNKRWKVLRERIEAMKEIWTKDAAEYHGEFVNFDPIWSLSETGRRNHTRRFYSGHCHQRALIVSCAIVTGGFRLASDREICQPQ